MLRISRLTDYAVVVTTHLARAERDRCHTVTALSSATGVPGPTVSKVLKALSRSGVVASQRGVNGGYRLAREPAAITVTEIITALEGPISVTECSSTDHTGCNYEDGCEVRGNWHRINTAVEQALSGISLKDMAEPSSELVQLRLSGS